MFNVVQPTLKVKEVRLKSSIKLQVLSKLPKCIHSKADYATKRSQSAQVQLDNTKSQDGAWRPTTKMGHEGRPKGPDLPKSTIEDWAKDQKAWSLLHH